MVSRAGAPALRRRRAAHHATRHARRRAWPHHRAAALVAGRARRARSWYPLVDHDPEPRSRLLVDDVSSRRRDARSLRWRPGGGKRKRLIRGPAKPVDASQDRQAHASHAGAGGWSPCVIGRGGDAAIMRRRSDASTTRNDTPSTAAVERILWARRNREAQRPARRSRCRSSPAQRIASRGRDGAPPLGHSLGQTRPYGGVSPPTPGICGRRDLRALQAFVA
jgi:hypothetical protein